MTHQGGNVDHLGSLFNKPTEQQLPAHKPENKLSNKDAKAAKNSGKKFNDYLNSNDKPSIKRGTNNHEQEQRPTQKGPTKESGKKVDISKAKFTKSPKTPQALKAWGQQFRRSNEARQSPVLGLIQGKVGDITAEELPNLVSNNGFISKALASDIGDFLSESHSIKEWSELLGVDEHIDKYGQQFEIKQEDEVTASQFLKSIGIDPHVVIAELSRLQETLTKHGLAEYSSRQDLMPAPATNPSHKSKTTQTKNLNSPDPQLTRTLASMNKGGFHPERTPNHQSKADKSNPNIDLGMKDSSKLLSGDKLSIDESPDELNHFNLEHTASKKNKSNIFGPNELPLGLEHINNQDDSVSTAHASSPIPLASWSKQQSLLKSKLDLEKEPAIVEAKTKNQELTSELTPDVQSKPLSGPTSQSFANEKAGANIIDQLQANGLQANSSKPIVFDKMENTPLENTPNGSDLEGIQNQISESQPLEQQASHDPRKTNLGLSQVANTSEGLMTKLKKDAKSLAPASLIDIESQVKAGASLTLGENLDTDEFDKEGQANQDQSAPLKSKQIKTEANILETSTTVEQEGLKDISAPPSSNKLDQATPELKDQQKLELISQITDRAKLLKAGGNSFIKIQDSELGDLSLAVQVEGNQIKVKMITPSEQIQNLLGSDLISLEENLANQDMKLVDVDIGQDRWEGRNPFNESFESAQQQQRQGDDYQEQLESQAGGFINKATSLDSKPLRKIQQELGKSPSSKNIQVMI